VLGLEGFDYGGLEFFKIPMIPCARSLDLPESWSPMTPCLVKEAGHLTFRQIISSHFDSEV